MFLFSLIRRRLSREQRAQRSNRALFVAGRASDRQGAWCSNAPAWALPGGTASTEISIKINILFALTATRAAPGALAGQRRGARRSGLSRAAAQRRVALKSVRIRFQQGHQRLNKIFVVTPALDKTSVDWLPNLPFAGRYDGARRLIEVEAA
jgi:hypothetical protein